MIYTTNVSFHEWFQGGTGWEMYIEAVSFMTDREQHGQERLRKSKSTEKSQ